MRADKDRKTKEVELETKNSPAVMAKEWTDGGP